ncbi:hypothetical protein F4778DRAFT_769458 [Xylariomycetidae sp. FL2044]|nr:hypothetical protein F4778DRAFT_769458 [Xylariomycetidae sp. FL2044]
MNDPEVLQVFASLVLFSNNPSTNWLNYENCDSTKKGILRALSERLDLQYSQHPSDHTVSIRKAAPEGTVLMSSGQISSTPLISTSLRPNSLNVASGQQDHLAVSSRLDENAGNAVFGDTPSLGFGDFLIPEDQGGLDSGRTPSQDRPTPVDRLGRRGSSNSLARTLKMVGACWRCRILRKKCDPDQPCRACPKPDSKSRWQGIGCKRGTLSDHSPEFRLCSKAIGLSTTRLDDILSYASRSHGIRVNDAANKHIYDVSERLRAVIRSEDTYTKIVLEILCSPLVDLSNPRIVKQHELPNNLLTIAWGLIDSPSAKAVLQLESADDFLDVVKSAAVYESEYGCSLVTSLAVDCLRNCIDIIRLYDAGHLTEAVHDGCDVHSCEVESIRSLSSNIKFFVDELSRLIFRKENRQHEKKWWLSAFYGLWLQSYVRRTIRLVEQQSLDQLRTLSPQTQRNCSDYLLLALKLFDAASAAYDPLVSTWSLEQEPVDAKFDFRLIKYYRMAQRALHTDQWADYNIKSSVDCLNHLYHDDCVNRGPGLPLRPGRNTETLMRRNLSHDRLGWPRPHSISQSPYMDHSVSSTPDVASSAPLWIRSAKRRASSPEHDMSTLRRNDSSDSMLNARSIRQHRLSAASFGSPLSSSYSLFHGRGNPQNSTDTLTDMTHLLSTGSPVPRTYLDSIGSSYRSNSTLNHKSSNESLLEISQPSKMRLARGMDQSSMKSPGFFMCECCPKRPKKFMTMEDLNAHETEKQFECGFCGNRFKTKNEADRHRNSLHVRRHSWSCSALVLVGFERAFHESPDQPGEVDVCGYCGLHFQRSARMGARRQVSETDLDERSRHLQEAHRFRDCNSSKKFYRADHFRQHLKHSHASSAGRWTNALENACQIVEEHPEGR